VTPTKLLTLTAGLHALESELGAALTTALAERDEARTRAETLDALLCSLGREILGDVGCQESDRIAIGVARAVHDLRARVVALETDLAATVRRTES
jgi:outer membrane murein-binding lipoprotein Lpp